MFDNIDQILEYSYKNNLKSHKISKLIDDFNNPQLLYWTGESMFKNKFTKFCFEYQIMLVILASNIFVGLIIYFITKITV